MKCIKIYIPEKYYHCLNLYLIIIWKLSLDCWSTQKSVKENKEQWFIFDNNHLKMYLFQKKKKQWNRSINTSYWRASPWFVVTRNPWKVDKNKMEINWSNGNMYKWRKKIKNASGNVKKINFSFRWWWWSWWSWQHSVNMKSFLSFLPHVHILHCSYIPHFIHFAYMMIQLKFTRPQKQLKTV